ncbi:MAG: hypothetical protein JW894_02385 [Bacteroidales bacterium]|nr:hypothetical protein [Bacteroidales bacterium]
MIQFKSEAVKREKLSGYSKENNERSNATMTKNQNDYFKKWLYPANEDILKIPVTLTNHFRLKVSNPLIV